jgi:glycosyltransferase involved in cell wall biosynthesis
MKIWRSYFRYPPAAGGMEQHIQTLSERQRHTGHEVVNIFHTGQSDAPHRRVLSWFPLGKLKPASLRNLIFYLSVLPSSWRSAGARPEIWHIHGDWSDFLAARWVNALGLRVPLVASVHGRLKLHHPALYRRALCGYRAVFVTGRREATFLQDLLDCPVIHMPSAPKDIFFTDTDQVNSVSALKETIDVISVGNFFPNKNMGLFLDCAALRRDLRFVAYGDGPERGALLKRITAERLRNVTLPGTATPEILRTAFAQARIFLSPSLEEGTPTVALEAMACGLPCVLTPSNDYDWLLKDGQGGWITKDWSPKEISDKISYFLAHPERLAIAAETNRAFAQNHRWVAKENLITGQFQRILNGTL